MRYRWPSAVCALIFIPMAVLEIEMYWNGSRDSGEPEGHTVRAVSKGVRHGKRTSYYVMTETWREGRTQERLQVRRSLHDQIVPGQTEIHVRIRPGALGQPWIESIAVESRAATDSLAPAPAPQETFGPVNDAYRRNNAVRTPFDTPQSTIEQSEREYVARLLAVCEEVMAARTEAGDALYRQGTAARELAKLEAAFQVLSAIPAPPRLENVKRLIVAAVDEQREFLSRWARRGRTRWWPQWNQEPLVVSSSQKLIAAYGELMALYPSEIESNKRSFHDTLCALDFI